MFDVVREFDFEAVPYTGLEKVPFSVTWRPARQSTPMRELLRRRPEAPALRPTAAHRTSNEASIELGSGLTDAQQDACRNALGKNGASPLTDAAALVGQVSRDNDDLRPYRGSIEICLPGSIFGNRPSRLGSSE
jgi:hypothetical protein